jgi:hypothetical protein
VGTGVLAGAGAVRTRVLHWSVPGLELRLNALGVTLAGEFVEGTRVGS